MKRLAVIALGLALLHVPVTSAQGQPPLDWRAEVAALLERRSAAVRTGDLRAFLATESAAPEPVRARHATWFRRARALPIDDYTLASDDDGYTDLAGGLIAPPRADEVRVVQAVERYRIRGYDQQPAAEPVFLTVARTGKRWSVVGDQDLEELGLLSARNLWDFGPVRTVARRGILVITRGDEATAVRIARATADAMAFVRRRWPFPWPARAVVLVPATETELARILRTSSDLDAFAAFTSSSVERPAGGFRLVGHRIFVQPDSFFDTSASFQAAVLGHEMLHLANRGLAGAYTPVWLDEGVAQIFGERAPSPRGAFQQAIRAGGVTALPRDHDFSTGTRKSIDVAYGAGASFAAFVRARFGEGALARLYRAMGAESLISLGTARYHHERATAAVLGRSLRTLERSWLQTIRRDT